MLAHLGERLLSTFKFANTFVSWRFVSQPSFCFWAHSPWSRLQPKPTTRRPTKTGGGTTFFDQTRQAGLAKRSVRTIPPFGTCLQRRCTSSCPTRLRCSTPSTKPIQGPSKGHRIQIYFGNLQEARSIRAKFRRNHPDTPCQLMPIDPNYAVTVGNYRDVWSARRALEEGTVGAWKHALVIPSKIDLPALR